MYIIEISKGLTERDTHVNDVNRLKEVCLRVSLERYKVIIATKIYKSRQTSSIP